MNDFFSLVRYAQLVEVGEDFYVGVRKAALSEGGGLALAYFSNSVIMRSIHKIVNTYL